MTSLQPIEPSTTIAPRNNRARQVSVGVATAVLVAILPMLVGAAGGNYWVRVLDFAMLYVMLALGLNVVVGFAGLLDLGYIAFYAVGAYTAALLASPHLSTQFAWVNAMFPGGLHTPYWVIVPVAMAIAAAAGVLLGAPTLRLRGDYLAIVTLGFGEIVRIFMNNLDRPYNITNGSKGITGIGAPMVGNVDLSRAVHLFGFTVDSTYLFFYLFVLCSALVALICVRLKTSRLGRAWAALREDEIAAKAMGLNPLPLKLLAFSMGASFGGLSGALFAGFQGFVSPESFTLWESVFVLACVVLGGIGHIPGVILGSVLLAILPEFLRSTLGPLQNALFGHQIVDTEVIRQLLYGLAMVLIMLYRSEGLWPAPKHEDRLARRDRRDAAKAARA